MTTGSWRYLVSRSGSKRHSHIVSAGALDALCGARSADGSRGWVADTAGSGTPKCRSCSRLAGLDVPVLPPLPDRDADDDALVASLAAEMPWVARVLAEMEGAR